MTEMHADTVEAKKTTVKSLAEDVKGKAQVAYVKGAAVAGELGTMTRGNVDAFVASSKILGAGLKEMGDASVTESKQAVDVLMSDLKSFTTVKSPVELFQLQMNLTKRNFDAAMALTSKNGKAIGKLATEAVAPLSLQAKVNVAKLRAAA